MATIIERAFWTVTEDVAMLMVEQGYIRACDSDHDMLDVDQPIFHFSNTRPEWVTLETLPAIIQDMQRAVEEYGELLPCLKG